MVGRYGGSDQETRPGAAAGDGWVELLLVRHARTGLNEESRYQGVSDAGLSEAGREQARELGEALRGALPDGAGVWSSSLRRSRETARLAFPGRELRPDPRLDELDLGRLEGRSHPEAKRHVGEPYDRWLRDLAGSAPPGGESPERLRRRTTDWVRDLSPGRVHVAVTHDGPIQCLTAMVLGVPWERVRLLKLEPGRWRRLLVPAGHEIRRGLTRPGGAGAGPPIHVDDGSGEDPGARIRGIGEGIPPLPGPSPAALRDRVDRLAKPPGSLGRLEEVAVRLGRILGDPPPTLRERLLFLFLADHGVAGQGVSAYPREVTAAMCRVLAHGGAGSQALASACGVDVVPVDVGVDADASGWSGVIDARVRRGTRDLSTGRALSREELARSVEVGATVVRKWLDGSSRPAIVGIGEMGIGNTTAAAAVAAALTGGSAEAVVGPGTGVTGEALRRKRRIVAEAVARLPEDVGPVDVLCEVGGLEIGGMVGAIMEGARQGMPVLMDGFISTTAALAAVRLAPAARGYLFAAHRSAEPGHGRLLGALELDPILDLDLRLGEGTGAVLSAPLLDAAGSILRRMAGLDEVAHEG